MIMSEIVLQLNDDINLERVVSMLTPYIAKAEIKQAITESKHKIWTGKAEWLDTPIKVDSFSPLSREEAHAR
jgi:ribosomal protein L31